MFLARSSESVIDTAVFTSDQKLATLPWSGATSSVQRMRKTWKVPSSRRQISAFHDPLGDFASSTSVRTHVPILLPLHDPLLNAVTVKPSPSSPPSK